MFLIIVCNEVLIINILILMDILKRVLYFDNNLNV